MTTLPISGSIKMTGDGWKPGKRSGETNLALIDDPRGYRTMVTKIAPGPLGEMHAHDEIEQIYVIEGDFLMMMRAMAPAISCCVCRVRCTAQAAKTAVRW